MDFGDDVAGDGYAVGLGEGGDFEPGGDAAGAGDVDDGDVDGAGGQGAAERVQSVKAFSGGDGDV